MNFDFSDEMNALRDQARKVLRDRSTTTQTRRLLDGDPRDGTALWQEIAALGWLGAAVPEQYGGAGLGYEGLCVIAEELGRALAPVPFSSSVFLAAEAITLLGAEAQKRSWLPRLADGSVTGTLALAEGPGSLHPDAIRAVVDGDGISGEKWPVPDGQAAGLAVVVARTGSGEIGCFLVDLAGPGVTRAALQSIDPSRPQARATLGKAPAERLGAGGGWESVQRVLDRAAALVAFEQLGGAAACLEIATAFAKERYAFGRPIGGYQAIKHKLADVFIANELARSNAYYAAWALEAGAADLPMAAPPLASLPPMPTASHPARASRSMAAWDSPGRRTATCSTAAPSSSPLGVGALPYWRERLVTGLDLRNAA